ncbi:4-hydroxy-2-oxoheptanedioate aldolase [Paenalcaligenes faecalis]|uniref:4-hydroxy-2-oxoheptanedioate aldolase n=1 Tax=Paenalcaligenes faecalis TaxID=2980099 RepID=UPI0022B9B212|nr:4-hydroxy-2-oxoheptanedioate aldolase [Paenalcaligenes faecalis]
MKLPINTFKVALKEGNPQIGLWLGLANSYTAELCAGIGYDWLLIDGEHAPNTLDSMLKQLQAIAPYPSHGVVRSGWNDPVEFKKLLDIGAQTILIPMIQSAAEARAAVQAVRYPPEGTRGVGAAIARASHWGEINGYLTQANKEICVLCQVETAEALTQLDDILAVEGVDGVFIGPADLAASMGHIGQSNHPEVKAVIDEAIVRIRKSSKAPGILMTDPDTAKHYLDLGALFVAIGVDTLLLRQSAKKLLQDFQSNA